ncbi:MAG TPA: endonuclease domain-containing protein [Allosphingosinicella sp.]
MKRPPGQTMLDRPRQLRRAMTDAETLLWTRLRSRQMGGFKFRRQMWLCGYIADFACLEARLVIEADGGQHDAAQGDDARRTAALAAEGYRILRFWNNDILANLDGVLLTIRDALPSPSHPAAPGGPLPLPNWERGL